MSRNKQPIMTRIHPTREREIDVDLPLPGPPPRQIIQHDPDAVPEPIIADQAAHLSAAITSPYAVAPKTSTEPTDIDFDGPQGEDQASSPAANTTEVLQTSTEMNVDEEVKMEASEDVPVGDAPKAFMEPTDIDLDDPPADVQASNLVSCLTDVPKGSTEPVVIDSEAPQGVDQASSPANNATKVPKTSTMEPSVEKAQGEASGGAPVGNATEDIWNGGEDDGGGHQADAVGDPLTATTSAPTIPSGTVPANASATGDLDASLDIEVADGEAQEEGAGADPVATASITPVTEALDASMDRDPSQDASAMDGQALVEGPKDDPVAEAANAPSTEASDASMDPVVDDEAQGEGPGVDPVVEAAIRLAGLSPLEYEHERKGAASDLGIRLPVLDAAVAQAQAQASLQQSPGGGKPVSFSAVEPWGEPVDAAQILEELQDTIHRFIVCENDTAVAAALWAAFTWVIDYVQVAPIAFIVSPEKRCGKTQLLDLLGRFSRRPLVASNISQAAVFRVIEDYCPTLFIDEADSFLKGNEPMRGILNSGHTRQSAYILRTEGNGRKSRRFSTWSAKAIASIGHLAGTIMDRSIPMPLKRKQSSETVQRLRYAGPDQFSTLVRKLARFAEDSGPAIAHAHPHLPPELNDRAQDNWEPLVAIADLAGGEWPQLARAAALNLSGEEHEALSPSAQLLLCIREALGQNDKISTEDLLAALVREDLNPWGVSPRRPISARQLATRLKEFGIPSKNIRLPGNVVLKGYRRDQFTETFDRYLPSALEVEESATPLHSSADATLQVADVVASAGAGATGPE